MGARMSTFLLAFKEKYFNRTMAKPVIVIPVFISEEGTER
jgi:hypothetical protein